MFVYALYFSVIVCNGLHLSVLNKLLITHMILRPIFSACRDVTVPVIKCINYGPCSFAVCGLTIWSSLPTQLGSEDLSIISLQHQLKTELYIKNSMPCPICALRIMYFRLPSFLIHHQECMLSKQAAFLNL